MGKLVFAGLDHLIRWKIINFSIKYEFNIKPFLFGFDGYEVYLPPEQNSILHGMNIKTIVMQKLITQLQVKVELDTSLLIKCIFTRYTTELCS